MTVTSRPAAARSHAAMHPAGPDPTTATRVRCAGGLLLSLTMLYSCGSANPNSAGRTGRRRGLRLASRNALVKHHATPSGTSINTPAASKPNIATQDIAGTNNKAVPCVSGRVRCVYYAMDSDTFDHPHKSKIPLGAKGLFLAQQQPTPHHLSMFACTQSAGFRAWPARDPPLSRLRCEPPSHTTLLSAGQPCQWAAAGLERVWS